MESFENLLATVEAYLDDVISGKIQNSNIDSGKMGDEWNFWLKTGAEWDYIVRRTAKTIYISRLNYQERTNFETLLPYCQSGFEVTFDADDHIELISFYGKTDLKILTTEMLNQIMTIYINSNNSASFFPEAIASTIHSAGLYNIFTTAEGLIVYRSDWDDTHYYYASPVPILDNAVCFRIEDGVYKPFKSFPIPERELYSIQMTMINQRIYDLFTQILNGQAPEGAYTTPSVSDIEIAECVLSEYPTVEDAMGQAQEALTKVIQFFEAITNIKKPVPDDVKTP